MDHHSDLMCFSNALVHGNIRYKPVAKIADVKLHKRITIQQNNEFKNLYRSQTDSLPILLSKRNTFLIGPNKSGKTFACVLSILNFLLDKKYYINVPKGNGPRCVFVTTSEKNARTIKHFCTMVCGLQLNVVTAIGWLEKKQMVALKKACDVLITTPKCLLRLLNSDIHLSRLRHAVFDDIDILLETFTSEVTDIFIKIMKMALEKELNIQWAFVGTKWSSFLNHFFKIIDSPVVCITDSIEATVYVKIIPTPHIVSTKNKVDKLKDILHSTKNKKLRTAIVCTSATEVVDIFQKTSDVFMPNLLVAHEHLDSSEINGIVHKWRTSDVPHILLCSDNFVNIIDIKNIQHLIHFTLSFNKKNLCKRFSMLLATLNDHINHPEGASPDCIVDILVSPSEDDEMEGLVYIKERFSLALSDEVIDKAKELHLKLEQRKVVSREEFCDQLLMFGKCVYKDKCEKRHKFHRSIDFNSELSDSLFVKVKFIFAHNPSHFSVRILETRAKMKEPWRKFVGTYDHLETKLRNYYSMIGNRIPVRKIMIGDMVAVELQSDGLFVRAEVVEFVSNDTESVPNYVHLKLIDAGYIIKRMAVELLYLPTEFISITPEVYSIYLTGLQPIDCEPEWSSAAMFRFSRSLGKLSYDEKDIFAAKIMFTAGNNLLASSLKFFGLPKKSKSKITFYSPREFLLKKKLAIDNGKHRQTLLELALEAGLISSSSLDIITDERIDVNYRMLSNNDDTQTENTEVMLADSLLVKWAHFQDYQYFSTSVVNVVSPSLFYLKNPKYSDRLASLERDLNNLLLNNAQQIGTIKPNMVCAVKNPLSDGWNRAILLEVQNTSKAKVFYVDYGNVMVVPVSNMSLLPKEFVSYLPFQALECSLVGIKPIEEQWFQDSVDYFLSLTKDENSESKPIHAKICEIKPSAKTTGGCHYQVILIDFTNYEGLSINTKMYYSAVADWDPATKVYLDSNSLK